MQQLGSMNLSSAGLNLINDYHKNGELLKACLSSKLAAVKEVNTVSKWLISR